jgi:8-oxo-dGTP pyrophosphatase MutT (NUDIX family)
VGSSASSRRPAKRDPSARHRQRDRRQQVAAVCYRIGGQGLEFLLVQTRGGRWIFPKGGVEPGLTQAQSAALEAFEEAGVHGRIEEMPFARYRPDQATLGKDLRRAPRSGRGKAVTAHLCEVSHLEPPQEANRNPTWFSAPKAKRRLLADRTAEFGAELVGVVDRAVARIQRMQASNSNEYRKDALQKVRFEAFENFVRDAALIRYVLFEQRGVRAASGAEIEGQGHLLKASLRVANRGDTSLRKIFPIGRLGQLRLGTGATKLQGGKKKQMGPN